jgi:hypothetical protein
MNASNPSSAHSAISSLGRVFAGISCGNDGFWTVAQNSVNTNEAINNFTVSLRYARFSRKATAFDVLVALPSMEIYLQAK